MRILFYEPDHTGHHFAYLARMLPGFVELPVELALATTREAIDSEQFQTLLAPFGNRLELLDVCRPNIKGNIIGNAWRRSGDLAASTRQWNPDHVCLLYADGMWELATLAQSIGYKLLGHAPTMEAWMYRGKFAYPEANRPIDKFRRRLFRRLLKQGLFTKIHFDDELVLDFVNQRPQAKTNVELPANPVLIREAKSGEAARAALGIAEGGPIISSSGQIALFKGMHLALDAFDRFCKDDESGARLLFAGPCEEPIARKIAEPRFQALRDANRLLLIDRFLTEEEMLLTAEASDLVLAPYPNHAGRSSIILWAAAAGKPSLGVNRGCIRHVIEAEQLGTICDVQDIPAFASALRDSLQRPWTDEDVARVRKYAEWHSIENYQSRSAALVRSRLGANG